MKPQNKKSVVLGITGSIAAYKGADLCSRLVKAGYDVTVIMTDSARKLVTEQTFLTLSRNPVITSLWEIPDWQPGHVNLADKADIFVVAPATANFIGKFANGIADDALTTFAISHDKPTILAPAMNPKMWKNQAVKDNCATLKKRGIIFCGPAKGHVACGADGEGRFEDVSVIFDTIEKTLTKGVNK